MKKYIIPVTFSLFLWLVVTGHILDYALGNIEILSYAFRITARLWTFTNYARIFIGIVLITEICICMPKWLIRIRDKLSGSNRVDVELQTYSNDHPQEIQIMK